MPLAWCETKVGGAVESRYSRTLRVAECGFIPVCGARSLAAPSMVILRGLRVRGWSGCPRGAKTSRPPLFIGDKRRWRFYNRMRCNGERQSSKAADIAGGT